MQKCHLQKREIICMRCIDVLQSVNWRDNSYRFSPLSRTFGDIR